MLQPNTAQELLYLVGEQDLASQLPLGPEDAFPPVLATARLIALMELTAARVLQPLLTPGQLSVGVAVDIKHVAATPVDAEIRIIATYLEPEGKLFRFRLEAFDAGGKIGEGFHTRAIVDTSRLVESAHRRVESAQS